MTTQEKALWRAIKQLERRLTSAAGGVPPSVHSPNHSSGSTDPIDILSLDGYPNGSPAQLFLREDGSWALPAGTGGGYGTVGAWLATVGDLVFIQCPFAGTIIEATITGFDATGASVTASAVVDVWLDDTYPPTIADTITASAKPTLTSDAIVSDSTLTGWTTTVAAGDWFTFTLESMSTAAKVLVQLTVQKS